MKASEPILQSSVDRYLVTLASAAPTPGGGAAAALTGAQGVALLEMVLNVTFKGKETRPQSVDELIGSLENLRSQLSANVEQDAAAFTEVLRCYRLPMETGEDSTNRKVQIQDALHNAAAVPLEVMKLCDEALCLSLKVLDFGSKQVASDAGAAANLLAGALKAASHSVRINLANISDVTFVKQCELQIEKRLEEALRQEKSVETRVGKYRQ